MKSSYFFYLLFSFFISFSAYSAEEPLIIIASDFDGTVTQMADHNFLSPVSIFQTGEYKDSSAYAIEKVLSPYNMTFDHMPFSLQITQEEALFFKSFFSKNGIIPSYKVLELGPIPELQTRRTKKVIIPGLYQLEYRAGFRENRFLLNDYRKSKKLAEKRGRKLKDLFNFGLDLIQTNLKKKNSTILIHTARGQSPQTFHKFFYELQKDKLLLGSKEDVNKMEIYPMGRPSAVIFGSDFNRRKRELLEKVLKSLELQLKPSPYREAHVIFADDELRNIYSIHDLFERESKSPHLNKVHFHVLFAGPTELVKELEVQNKHRFVTYQNGIQTPISGEHAKLIGLPLQRVRELSNKIKNFNKPVSKCRQIFIKGS